MLYECTLYGMCIILVSREYREVLRIIYYYLFVNVVRFDRGNCCACCLHKKYQKRIIIWHLLFRENLSKECCIIFHKQERQGRLLNAFPLPTVQHDTYTTRILCIPEHIYCISKDGRGRKERKTRATIVTCRDRTGTGWNFRCGIRNNE